MQNTKEQPYSKQVMYDIIEDDKAVLEKCRRLGIKPLVIGKDVELADSPVKLSKALLTVATSSRRDVLESNVDAVTDIESAGKKDFMHHRNSGLDQVTASILTKRVNPYILNMRSLLEAQKPAVVLGRMLQNVRIAKKFSIPVILASFAGDEKQLASINDQKAFWRGLGVDEQIVKDSQRHFEELVSRSKKRSEPGYEAEGVHRYETI